MSFPRGTLLPISLRQPPSVRPLQAYAYAKRGQVLLAEQWTETPPNPAVKVVSCHPGWVRTPGVMTVYGDKSKYGGGKIITSIP